MADRPGGDPEIAAYVLDLYPNQLVRGQMYDECLNLTAWAGMNGRREALAWLEIASALRLSLHPSFTGREVNTHG